MEYKVIFHIDELNKWKLLLGNVSNLLQAMDKETIRVEVLANAEAVKYYDMNQKLNADSTLMETLHQKAVRFVACDNALKANQIERDHLLEFVEVVPAGVAELVIKQSEGYAYIKP